MITLPIDAHIKNILQKAFSDKSLILTASPGSGKTTRVPAQLLIAFREQKNLKKIIVIVPKRLAAVAACDRIATENGWQLGTDVGYQVRFESNCKPDTQLLFMTEGLFLKKAHDQKFLNEIGVIILDEFHERSAHIDLILGICFERKLLTVDRSNTLQIIVMSATLNTEKLKKYFDQEHNHIDITQKPFNLEIIYQKTSQRLICDKDFYENIKSVTLTAFKKSKKDILIFLPGFREILKTQAALKPLFPSLQIEFIYGGMNLADQKRILNKMTNDRRIICATNIAESSLTLPDLDCVIDCGLEKTAVREKKMGFSKLETLRISKFSATQRAGRAARLSDGFCFRLWHEIDDRSLPEQKKPEILDSTLLEEILLLVDLGHSDANNFSWLDKPSADKIQQAFTQLKKWKLITDDGLQITEHGQNITRLPLDIASSVLFYELNTAGFKKEACELFSKLETTDFSKRQKNSPYDLNTDLDYLFSLDKTENQKKIYMQLMGIPFLSPPNDKKADPMLNFEITVLEIFSNYIPERICLKKSALSGLSASGRGVAFSENSSVVSEKIPNDYIIALSGYEQSASTTVIDFGIGYDKAAAMQVLKKYLVTENKIEFKAESNKFIKKTVQKFGEFIFNETSPETLKNEELAENWKAFVVRESSVFLNLNPSFEKIINKIHFLKSKVDVLKLPQETFDFLSTFETNLVTQLTENITEFKDFLEADFIYYLNDVLSEDLRIMISELPDHIQLPTGRTVTVDYIDPKAPLISAKIQDCFQWHQTPKILNQILPLTIQLLAPNMRPAQITSDLNTFWKNSYKDVRKDLRARYPKHRWPEDPTIEE